MALQALDAYLGRSPKDANAYLQRGKLREKTGKTESAKLDYKLLFASIHSLQTPRPASLACKVAILPRRYPLKFRPHRRPR